jgi:hypothetical protein
VLFLEKQIATRMAPERRTKTRVAHAARVLWIEGVPEARRLTGLGHSELAFLRRSARRQAYQLAGGSRGLWRRLVGGVARRPAQAEAPSALAPLPAAIEQAQVAEDASPSGGPVAEPTARQRAPIRRAARRELREPEAPAPAQLTTATPDARPPVPPLPARPSVPVAPWQIVPPVGWAARGYRIEVLFPCLEGIYDHESERGRVLGSIDKIRNRLDGDDDWTLFGPAALGREATGLYEERSRNFRLVYTFRRDAVGAIVTLVDFQVKADIVRSMKDKEIVDKAYFPGLLKKLRNKDLYVVDEPDEVAALDGWLFGGSDLR